MCKSILFSIHLAVLLLFFAQCKEENRIPDRPETKKIDSVKNEPENNSETQSEKRLLFYPVLHQKAITKTYFANKSGELLLGEVPFKIGQKVDSNHLLFHIDKSILFQEIKTIKTELKTRLLHPNTHNESWKTKWNTFGQLISYQDVFPEVPKIRSTEEKDWLEKEGILFLLQQGIDAENEIQAYYQLANENGTICQIWKNAGTRVLAQDRILEIQTVPATFFFQSTEKVAKTDLLTLCDQNKKPFHKTNWVSEKKTGKGYTYFLSLSSEESKELKWILIEKEAE